MVFVAFYILCTWNELPFFYLLLFTLQGLIDNYDDKYCEFGRKQLELEREFFRTAREIPLCCRYHLKRIVIKRYYGEERERRLIQFFLRHALVLEELVIYPVSEVSFSDRMLVQNTLNNLPKASVTCLIQVL